MKATLFILLLLTCAHAQQCPIENTRQSLEFAPSMLVPIITYNISRVSGIDKTNSYILSFMAGTLTITLRHLHDDKINNLGLVSNFLGLPLGMGFVWYFGKD